MSRGPQNLRRGDVTKTIKGAVNAGLSVQRVEVDKDGKIIVFTGKQDDPSALDQWRRGRGQG
jgi:hypothetical protein